MQVTLELNFRLLHGGECFCRWVINTETLNHSHIYTLLHKIQCDFYHINHALWVICNLKYEKVDVLIDKPKGLIQNNTKSTFNIKTSPFEPKITTNISFRDNMIKSISNIIVSKVNAALNESGLRVSELLKRSGISNYEIDTPGLRLSEEQYYSFISHGSKYVNSWSEQALEFITKHNNIDLAYSLSPQLTGLCLNEKSAYESLLAYINNRVIIGNVEEIIISIKSDETKIAIIDHSPGRINTIPLIGVMAHLYSLAKTYHPTIKIKAGFTINNYKYMISDFFGANCAFNQEYNYIIFNNEDLFSKNQSFNPFLYKYQKTEIERETTYLLYNNSFLNTVIVLIEKAMSTHDIHTENSILEYVCNNLRISRWTLNQKLKFEDINFSLLLRKVRLQKACDLLVTTNMSMQEISDRLLFSSQAVFSRFFSSNIGESPIAFRKKHWVMSKTT